MVVFADNDIVFKLARCRLLSALLEWLECPPNDVAVLPELSFVGKKKLAGDEIALAEFQSFLQHVSIIPAASFSMLERFSSLDVGEQQLLAVFMETQGEARLISGDKRALRGVAALARNDASLAARVSGRVDCLEGVLLGLTERHGFAVVNQAVLGGLASDGVLKLAFGPRRTQAHALEALRSWLGELQREADFVVSR